jgi:hypothetical protein
MNIAGGPNDEFRRDGCGLEGVFSCTGKNELSDEIRSRFGDEEGQ